MWRLWHRLFGWHYASVSFGYDWYIRRVQTDGDGRPYIRTFDRHIDLKEPGHYQWRPLTFPRGAVEEAGPSADVIVMPRKVHG